MANQKSAPVSIRFDIEKVDFLKEREGDKKYQQVVDFLLEKYWWENKMGVKSAHVIPSMNEHPSVTYLAANPHPVQKSVISAAISITPYQEYEAEILASREMKELNAIIKEVFIDKKLTANERVGLQTLADKKSQDFFL